MRKFLLSVLLFFSLTMLAQPYTNSSCSTALQIVSGQTYSYTAWTGYNYPEVGPDYYCLTYQYDPAWFCFMVGSGGDIHINLYSVVCKDIDFVLWGPFSSLDEGCNGGLTATKVVDCSFTTACSENADLPLSTAGEYYIMMISNFSKVACTVYLSQTSGSGIMSYIPAPAISNNGPICAGQNLMLTANSVAGASYSWTGPNGFTSTLQNPVISNITAAQAGTYTCTLGLGNLYGPGSTTQVVLGLPTQPPFVPYAPICAGSAVAIGGPPVSGMTYSWTSNPPGYSSSLANPVVSPAFNTLYTLAATLGGCTATVSSAVMIMALPNAFAGNDNAVCEGNSINLGLPPAAGNNYSWTSSAADFSAGIANPTVTPLLPTSYFLNVTGSNGCSKQDTVFINVFPKPLAITGPNQNICNGTSTSLGISPVPGNTYAWTSMPVGFSSSLANPGVSPAVPTTYTLVETNSNNCFRSNSVTVDIYPVPAAFTGPNQTICAGTSINLGAVGVPGSTYTWTSVPAGFAATISNPSIQPAVQTIYTLTETNASNCTQTHSVTIAVNPVPNPILQANVANCAGSPLSIGIAQLPGNTYLWSSNPPGFSSSLANPSVNPSSTTTYTLVQTISATGCNKSATKTVTVNPKPAAYTGIGGSICSGNSITLGGPNVPGSQFFWTSNPSGFTSSLSNVSVSPSANTTYILTELNISTNCFKTNTVNVTVITKPKVQGLVKYDNVASTGLDSCRINLLDPPASLLDFSNTSSTGNYTINCLDPGYYKLSPLSNKKWGGVNATDAMIIAQYAVGLVPLSNLRKLAADVNQSGYVNALDAFMVMRRFVGQINSFNSGDWLLPTPDSTQIASAVNTVNITGLCFGDVNGSFIPPCNVIAPNPAQEKSKGTESKAIPMEDAIRNNQLMIIPHE